MRPVLLALGGTDPSGGAGLPADLLAAAAMGAHCCPVVTSVTVQNSGNIILQEPVSSQLLISQMNAVCEDAEVGSVKSGMLGSAGNALALAGFLKERLPGIPYVLDPVLRAGGGGAIADEEILAVIRNELLPLCSLCTPNLSEAGVLTGTRPRDEVGMLKAAEGLLKQGAGAVLVKGGHLSGDPVDILITEDGTVRFPGSRIGSAEVHGTGCSLGSAIGSLLAFGFDLPDAVREAKRHVRSVIGRSFPMVHGRLPGHFPEAAPMPVITDAGSFYSPPRFCPACGNTLNREPASEGHIFCLSCGHVHYRNPLPAVALLVRCKEKILLVRRAVDPARGMLCLPGGFLELGETPADCGRRELREETGIHIEECRIHCIETDMTQYGGILLVCLEVTGWSGDPVPGDDASEIVWTDLDRVPDLAFRAHARILEGYASQLSSERVFSSDS